MALSACAVLPSPAERRAHADALASARGWQASLWSAGTFELLAYTPPLPAAGSESRDTLTVYIEGDGLAWVTSSQPSGDPTPRAPLALQLALAHPAGPAAYLARPCQYTMPHPGSGRGCDVAYWTQRRFAPEVVQAESLALDALKHRWSARRLVLVGYSGGGAVAALLAARRDDVAALVTVAGNLDHAAWTRLHGVPPLTGSLNPADERAALARIPQWHLVGADDRVVPPAVAQAYAAGFPPGQSPRVMVLPGQDHGCCWAARWPTLWRDFVGIQPNPADLKIDGSPSRR